VTLSAYLTENPVSFPSSNYAYLPPIIPHIKTKKLHINNYKKKKTPIAIALNPTPVPSFEALPGTKVWAGVGMTVGVVKLDGLVLGVTVGVVDADNTTTVAVVVESAKLETCVPGMLMDTP
jgi:hypothetical protein